MLPETCPAFCPHPRTWNFTKTVTPEPEPEPTEQETGSVYVQYITEDGKVLEAENAIKEDVPLGEKYKTEQKTFEGYVFTKMGENSAPAEGSVTKGELHVTYVYKAKESSTESVKPSSQEETSVSNTSSEVPKSSTHSTVPKTGENNSLILYALVMFASAISILIIRHRRRRNGQ